MKLFKLSAFVLLFLTGTLSAQEYAIDASASSVKWIGEKVTGKHDGTVNISSGALMMKEGKLSGGKVEIDMTSIKNTDMEDGEYRAKLEGHLKSDDFFGVATFPTATLVITNAVHQGKNDYKVMGRMTIKGITKPIKFNAQIEEKEGALNGNATIVIDRSEYNVKYGSGSFFDDLGDKTIYDEFTMEVKISGKKA